MTTSQGRGRFSAFLLFLLTAPLFSLAAPSTHAFLLANRSRVYYGSQEPLTLDLTDSLAFYPNTGNDYLVAAALVATGTFLQKALGSLAPKTSAAPIRLPYRTLALIVAGVVVLVVAVILNIIFW